MRHLNEGISDYKLKHHYKGILQIAHMFLKHLKNNAKRIL